MSLRTWLADDTFAIFLFHGVIREHRHPIRNYTHKHLDVATFTAVLDDLAAQGTAVGLPEIFAARAGGHSLPPRAFALTFDDGFANNAEIAAPLLRARGLPATFYVTTSFVDTDGASWTDIIEAAVEAVPIVRLQLPACGASGVFRTAEEKIWLLDRIRTFVKAHREVDPYGFARDIRRQLGSTTSPSDPALDRKMSWDQVRALDGDPLFTIGGHGHTHRILEYLDDGELRSELDASLATLAKQLGRPVQHYSYPEGLPHC